MKTLVRFSPALLLALAGQVVANDVTRPGDVIIPSSPNHPAGEPAPAAIDNTARTKYLNFDEVNTGFTVTPTGTGVVRHLTIITANDDANRDPFSYVLEGTDDGINFTHISSGDMAPSTFRFSIYSPPGFENKATYASYRVTFPTVRNAAANSMQVAEVQLATSVDVTSPNDQVRITLPAGAFTAAGENTDKLFDNRLDTKLDVQGAFLGATTVEVTPAAGPTVITGLSFFSGNDDATAVGRTPQNLTVLGTNNGVDYTQIYTTPMMPATDNYQDQEFEFANTTSYIQYRIIFDVPFASNDMQVGDVQLMGVAGTLAPENDDCAAAPTIGGGTEYSGTTVLATGTDITSCGTNDAADVWYRYVATATGPVEVSTRGSASDTTLAVFSSCGGTSLACDDDGMFAQSVVRVNAVTGTAYLIRVAGADGGSGAFRLTVNENPGGEHTDTPVALTYNFNGLVHEGEAGMPDAPNGYRSIASRGLTADLSANSLGGGRVVGRTGIVYEIEPAAGQLDTVFLGVRTFDTVVDTDEIGVQPDWIASGDQSGPQVSDVSSQGIVMTPETRIGLLYHVSNGGGFFYWTLNFDDFSSAALLIEGPDWFSDRHPGPAGFGVETQAQMGVFEATESTDRASPGTGLNVIEAITSVERLLGDGFGDFAGRRLVSMSFSERTNTGAGYGVYAATVRDAQDNACRADFNRDGIANSQDFFDFLTAFFGNAPSADFNGDDIINSQDFFDFLTAFFAGC